MKKNIKLITRTELADYITELEERATVTATKIERAEKNGSEAEGLGSLLIAIDNAIKEARAELDRRKEEPAQNNQCAGFNPVASYGMRTVASYDMSGNGEARSADTMNPEQIRAFQSFLVKGVRGMSETEVRALDTSGSAAVIPTDIFNKLVTDTKYSDLLNRANIINDGTPGKVYIPIASGASASWHEENAAGSDTTPTLTKIELGGSELMALMKMSTATATMSYNGFTIAMLDLLSAEVVEKLENDFINGTTPVLGLAGLTWDSTNSRTTEATEGVYRDIGFKDLAAGLALLPQKYARNAVLLMNATTAYSTLAAQDDSNGAPIFSIVDMPNKILGHEVVISEHCPDDTVFIVDPKELYVRFSMPIQVESDKSSGFTSAQINIRALCVAAAAWNAAACVKVEKGADTI